ncbi:MAG: ABC transporter permease [Eubacteriales bacterium]
MGSLLNAIPGACAQGLIWGIMAIGVYITYRVLDFPDLTVDGTMCTGGAVCIMLMLAGCPMWLAFVVAFLVGMLAGVVTGVFHTVMGIPAILSGILTQLGLYSVNLRIMGDKANQAINVDNYDLFVSLRYINKTIVLVTIFTVVVIMLLYWFFGTEIGSAIRATGCNENMSRAQGINTNANKVIGLALSNGIVALSSALLAQYNGFVDVNMGRGAIVIGLAAVIIGQVVFYKIKVNFAFRLLSVSLGAIVYYLVIQAVISFKILGTNDLKLLSALIVAGFLSVMHLPGKYAMKKAKKGGAKNA